MMFAFVNTTSRSLHYFRNTGIYYIGVPEILSIFSSEQFPSSTGKALIFVSEIDNEVRFLHYPIVLGSSMILV